MKINNNFNGEPNKMFGYQRALTFFIMNNGQATTGPTNLIISLRIGKIDFIIVNIWKFKAVSFGKPGLGEAINILRVPKSYTDSSRHTVDRSISGRW